MFRGSRFVRRVAGWNVVTSMRSMAEAGTSYVQTRSRAACTAGCAHRQTGKGFRYCSRTVQRVPRSSHTGACSADGLSTAAGAPVKPSAASRAADTPTCAPHPELSLTIDGWSMHRIIGARGAWYSAVPRACTVADGSRPPRRENAAAAPRAFHAPELW